MLGDRRQKGVELINADAHRAGRQSRSAAPFNCTGEIVNCWQMPPWTPGTVSGQEARTAQLRMRRSQSPPTTLAGHVFGTAIIRHKICAAGAARKTLKAARMRPTNIGAALPVAIVLPGQRTKLEASRVKSCVVRPISRQRTRRGQRGAVGISPTLDRAARKNWWYLALTGPAIGRKRADQSVC